MIDTNKLRDISQCKGRLIDAVGRDNIIQLAQNGICPHYLFTNPVTNENQYFFIPSDLNYWLYNNYVISSDGIDKESYNFYKFIKKEEGEFDNHIPDELCKIKNIQRLPLEEINTPSGVYFLCKEKEIVYIGQATNISRRILTHLREGLKTFDSVYFIICSVAQLNELETRLIRYYKPKYNSTAILPLSKKDIEFVDSFKK